MFIPLTPSLHQDETLKEIDAYLFKLEHVVFQEYRRLLAGTRKGLDELLRFPAQIAGRFQQILAKLQRALEGTGDRANLRIVTDHQEELRVRMLMLEHLLERDIPYAYLERALHPAVHSAIFAHRGEGVEHAPAQPAGGTPSRHWLTRAFRQERSATASPKPVQHQAGLSGIRGSVRRWFQDLPDYLRSLFLLHHFMEKDELRLLKPSQRVPGLGEAYSLNLGVAVFEAEDLGEFHWRARAERRQTGRPDDHQLARSLQEKLTERNYLVGVRSQFHINSNRGGGRGAPGAEQLRQKLRHLAGPSGVRASFDAPEASQKAADETPWLVIDYKP